MLPRQARLSLLKLGDLKNPSEEEAKSLGEEIGIDWKKVKFPVSEFQQGLPIELEHGKRDPKTNVTDDDPKTTAKIDRAHLEEIPDYYSKLKKHVEKKANGDEGGPDVPMDEVKSWLREHPNPDDSDVHAWADSKGWNKHKVEEVIYQLASAQVKDAALRVAALRRSK